MPIYEFYSPDTNRIYSFFARSLAEGLNLPRCPDDPAARMERVISQFAVASRSPRKSAAGESVESADPRMEKVMAQMEREMSTMDIDHPDPRQLGKLMRTMTEATGHNVPEPMQQMIERLERGEDPNALEEEFGTALENLADPGDPDTAASTPARKSRPPQRDPRLYEMREFIGESRAAET